MFSNARQLPRTGGQGRLLRYQQIIEVNGQFLVGVMHQEAVNILRNAGDKINFIVSDGLNPSALQNSEGNENYIGDMDVQLLGANLLADTSITSEI